MPYVATNLGRLFVESTGEGPLVTFWHCLFGDSSIFRKSIEGIQRTNRVLLVDGPSHGRSDPWLDIFTLDQCADAWIEVLDHLGMNEPAVFSGLSWGSMVAQRVALRHPHRVRKLILMSTSALKPRLRALPQFIALAKTVRYLGFPDWLLHRMAPTMISPENHARNPRLVYDMLSRNRHLDRRALHQAAMSVMVKRDEVIDHLWRIHVPTWVLVGEHDRLTTVRAARAVASAIDTSHLQIIQGAGHLLTLEAPSTVGSMLEEAIAHREERG